MICGSPLIFLSEKYGLWCPTPTEKARANMMTEGIRDWIYEFFDVTYCNAMWLPYADPHMHIAGESQCKIYSPKFESTSVQYKTGRMLYHLTLYEQILHCNGADSQATTSSAGSSRPIWLIGAYLTYVDFIFAEYLMQHEIFDPLCLQTFPLLQKYLVQFEALPSIAAYLNDPAKYRAEPIHNRYSHFHTGWLTRNATQTALPVVPAAMPISSVPATTHIARTSPLRPELVPGPPLSTTQPQSEALPLEVVGTTTTGGVTQVVGYWNTRALGEPLRLILHYVNAPFIDKRYEEGPPPAYEQTDWLKEKEQLGLDIPNLPYYVEVRVAADTKNDDDDMSDVDRSSKTTTIRLTQMHAIAGYMGDKYGLQGRTRKDTARVVMMVEAIRDWAYSFYAVTACNKPNRPNNRDRDGRDGIESAVHIEGEKQCLVDSPKFAAVSSNYRQTAMLSHLTLYENILRKNAELHNQATTTCTAGSSRPIWLIGAYLTYVDFIFAEYLMQHEIFDPLCLQTFPLLQKYLVQFKTLPSIAAYLNDPAKYHAEPIHNRYSHFHTGWIHS